MSAQESHTDTHTGNCLCGGVNFTVQGPPNTVYCCYCKDCSLGAGGPCQITASYFSSEFTLHDPDGLVARYEITTGTASGKPKDKYFCRRCGCTLFTIPFTAGAKEIVVRPALMTQRLTYILGIVLTGDGRLHIFKPSIECFTERRPGYFSACEGAIQYQS
ncbi:GFA family protein [Aspergillus puulaauensis]|uniref:CENP-V/GFA domain-containing protein n=1 Tax=Aspergillus puulaauensis TaxID=1220207 RepID=A0A7R7XX35_9EURO|nr:uncharacterized protein APUU_70880A [Aspergillus puulaauensis]BCS29310.1 hypothetical protein APUU_70880A [Aspergillus puulaauensis]